MAVLPYESDIYPDTLLDSPPTDARWWAAYTLARREKVFMQGLRKFNIPFYGPLIKRTTRSPSGRVCDGLFDIPIDELIDVLTKRRAVFFSEDNRLIKSYRVVPGIEDFTIFVMFAGPSC